MPLYLSRFKLTTDAWKALVADPQDRREATKKGIESVGGKYHGVWYSMGSQEGYTMFEMPDHLKMAANVLAVKISGAVEWIEIDTIYTMEEMLEVMRSVGNVDYKMQEQPSS